jgi:hypothetical protein
MLTYAQVCARMQVLAGSVLVDLEITADASYAHVCSRVLTYAGVGGECAG